MKGYKLSFILSGVLIIGAFVALYFEKSSVNKLPVDASYVLFIGGFILAIVGQKEYNQQQNLENKKNGISK